MLVSRQTRTVGESLAVSPSAASGGCSEGTVCAVVDKIEEKRKPEDFIGHRKRTPAPEKARESVLFQLYSPSAGYIGYASDIYFASDIPAGVRGEYNITSALAEISLSRSENITPPGEFC